MTNYNHAPLVILNWLSLFGPMISKREGGAQGYHRRGTHIFSIYWLTISLTLQSRVAPKCKCIQPPHCLMMLKTLDKGRSVLQFSCWSTPVANTRAVVPLTAHAGGRLGMVGATRATACPNCVHRLATTGFRPIIPLLLPGPTLTHLESHYVQLSSVQKRLLTCPMRRRMGTCTRRGLWKVHCCVEPPDVQCQRGFPNKKEKIKQTTPHTYYM